MTTFAVMLAEIRALVPELENWRENRRKKNLDTATLDRTLAVVGEIKMQMEAEMHSIKHGEKFLDD